MRILLIYHFFQPDPVISARLFTELAEELGINQARGDGVHGQSADPVG